MIRKVFKATWEYLLVRVAVAFISVLLYILIATQLQFLVANILGKSTFMYILSGFMSLIVSYTIVIQIFNFIILFVNGCQIAAIPYVDKILNKEFSSLAIGYYSFKAHIGSFGLVTGIRFVLGKLADSSSDYISSLLKSNPFGEQLIRISNIGIFKYIIKDIFNSSYDCIVYYLVKYTKPGASDDCKSIYEALVKYILILPKIMLTSFSSFILIEVIGKVVVIGITIYTVLISGMLAAIKIYMILSIIYFILVSLMLKPLSSIAIISVFAANCNKDSNELEGDCSKIIEPNVLDNMKTNITEFLRDRGIDVPDISNDSDYDGKEIEVESDVETSMEDRQSEPIKVDNTFTRPRRRARQRTPIENSHTEHQQEPDVTQYIKTEHKDTDNNDDHNDINKSMSSLVSMLENSNNDLNIEFTDIDIFEDD